MGPSAADVSRRSGCCELAPFPSRDELDTVVDPAAPDGHMPRREIVTMSGRDVAFIFPADQKLERETHMLKGFCPTTAPSYAVRRSFSQARAALAYPTQVTAQRTTASGVVILQILH